MKPGSLVIFKSPSYSESIFLRDHLTWTECRGRVLNGEVCVILEVEDNGHVLDTLDVKVLDPRGCVGWTLSKYFKVIEDEAG